MKSSNLEIKIIEEEKEYIIFLWNNAPILNIDIDPIKKSTCDCSQ
jgi:hypothetical protein